MVYLRFQNNCMKAKRNQIAIFVLGSFVFLLFPIISSPDFPHVSFTLSNPNGLRETLTHVLMLGLFYLCYFWLIPRFYFRQRYVAFYSWLTVTALCMFLLMTALNLQHRRQGPTNKPKHDGASLNTQTDSDGPLPPYKQDGQAPAFNILRFIFFDYNLYLFLIVLFASLLLKTNQRWRKLQREQLETELSFLKAQINPHFLFNTLNSIYALAIEKSDYTATAVVKLSGMMRYIISESNRNFVSLEKEIKYIDDYIELQKFRLGGTVQIEYAVNGNYSGREIAPLILITFVENAFKYGVNPAKVSKIMVSITIAEERLQLWVENNKVVQNSNQIEASGLGITNTKNRMEALYTKRHKLNIDDSDEKFKVNLDIIL